MILPFPLTNAVLLLIFQHHLFSCIIAKRTDYTSNNYKSLFYHSPIWKMGILFKVSMKITPLAETSMVDDISPEKFKKEQHVERGTSG